MSASFAKGLVVGKFCPLHAGHQRVIERAFADCGEVILISYTKPEFDRCAPEDRERWLAALYPAATRLVIDDARLQVACAQHSIAARPVPHNDAPDEDHRFFCGWLCDTVLRTRVDAVFTSEDYGDGFAQSLTAYFGARGRDGPSVSHVCVDPARAAVPVTGTWLRSDLDAGRSFLAPVVRADFVRRVAILGGESTGKTTLAQALANSLRTVWAPEYGRERWVQRDGRLVPEDLPEIGRLQVERERERARDASGWLVCDTTPLTTLFYSRHLFGHADPQLERLAQRHYDHVLLCWPDIAFVQDGTRQDEAFRLRQHAWYLAEFAARGIGFTMIEGARGERLASALASLDRRGQ